MGIADKRRERMAAYVAPQMEPGETIVANLPHSQTGPTPWIALLTYLYIWFVKIYGVVVTDRRVLMVRRTLILGRIKGVESAIPIAQVRVTEWKSGTLWSVLKLEIAGTALRLNVHRMHRDDAERLVTALGSAVAPPSA